MIESIIQSEFVQDSREIWEAAVIGALIRGEGKNIGLCDLEDGDFSTPSLKSLYVAIMELSINSEPIDEFTVFNKAGKLPGIAQAISNSINSIPTCENLEYYIQNLKRHCFIAGKEQLQRAASIQLKTAENPVEISEAMNRDIAILEEKYSDTRLTESHVFPNAVEVMMQNIETKKARENVLFTGIPFLDRLTRGLMPADNLIIAARPSQGKTAILLQILASIAGAGQKSCFFSKEMTEDALSGRLLAHVSGQDSTTAIREPDKLSDEDQRFFLGHRYSVKTIASNIILYTHGIDLRFVRKKAKDAVARGAKVIALDYLQLMDADGRSRNEEIELISRGWKNLLKELMVPGIMLSQLSRECEKDNRRPRLSDLRDGGAIEQDSDLVWFLHREKVNSKDRRPDAPTQTVLLQEKGRNVGRGMATLNFNGRSQTFFQMENQEKDQ